MFLIHHSTFNALKIAQDILDHDRLIIWKNDILGVYRDRELMTYTHHESQAIVHEFHDMFQIAKRCTLLCDPLRKKLEKILFVCTALS